MVLRLLILKHIRNWSYAVSEREVGANLVYRDFTRVGAGKTPDAKTMSRWGPSLGSRNHQADQRPSCAISATSWGNSRAPHACRYQGSRNEYSLPTDSSLLGDGVRVLTRTMKKITKIVGDAGAKLRNRSRSVKYRMLEISRATRAKGQQQETLRASLYPIAQLKQQGPGPGEAILPRDQHRYQMRYQCAKASRT